MTKETKYVIKFADGHYLGIWMAGYRKAKLEDCLMGNKEKDVGAVLRIGKLRGLEDMDKGEFEGAVVVKVELITEIREVT